MRQGEIRDLHYGVHRTTAVILSADTWNTAFPPLVAPIRRGLEPGSFFPAIVALHDTDPYGGAVDLTDAGTVNTTALGDKVHGIIGGQTMQRLREALAAMVEG